MIPSPLKKRKKGKKMQSVENLFTPPFLGRKKKKEKEEREGRAGDNLPHCSASPFKKRRRGEIAGSVNSQHP